MPVLAKAMNELELNPQETTVRPVNWLGTAEWLLPLISRVAQLGCPEVTYSKAGFYLEVF